MVGIRQDVKPVKLEKLLYNLNGTNVRLDSGIIQSDIDRLERKLGIIKKSTVDNRKINTDNIKNIIKYLEKLDRRAKRSTINIKWVLDGERLKSYPIELLEIPEYSIYTTDYLKLGEDEKLVYLDYTELSNMIAFGMMYKDLGESNSTIENKLKDVGVIAIADSDALVSHMPSNLYEESKFMKVESTPYFIVDGKKMVDYFGSEWEFDGRYRKVVGVSCIKAMTLIYEGILQEHTRAGKEPKLVSVTETGLYLLGKGDNAALVEEYTTSAYIRVFGRKFKVEPNIQIY